MDFVPAIGSDRALEISVHICFDKLQCGRKSSKLISILIKSLCQSLHYVMITFIFTKFSFTSSATQLGGKEIVKPPEWLVYSQ